MPRAEARRGDTVRDPRVLLALATLLVLLRIGITVWEERHPPARPDQPGSVMPGTAPPVQFFHSGSAVRRTP
jgi:hypothetical protein